MWRRAALCVAGLAGITVCAALAEETTHVAISEAPQGSYVCYLEDDPPTAQAAAGRVLRLLEILGVHHPNQPNPLPAPTGTETALPAPPAGDAGPLETAGAVAFQDEGRTSENEGRTSPLVAASPHFFMSKKNRDSSWPIINDLRDPARTRTALYQDEGNRDTHEQGIAAAANPSESAASPAFPVASPARPVPPIICPEGMTSSRRTIQLRSRQDESGASPGGRASGGQRGASSDADSSSDPGTSELLSQPAVCKVDGVPATLASPAHRQRFDSAARQQEQRLGSGDFEFAANACTGTLSSQRERGRLPLFGHGNARYNTAFGGLRRLVLRTAIHRCGSGASGRSRRQDASGRQIRSRRGPDENLRQRRVHAHGHSVAKTPLGPAALTGVATATNRGEPAEFKPRLGWHRSLGHAAAVAQHAARPSQGPGGGFAAADRAAVATAIAAASGAATADEIAAATAPAEIAAACSASNVRPWQPHPNRRCYAWRFGKAACCGPPDNVVRVVSEHDGVCDVLAVQPP